MKLKGKVCIVTGSSAGIGKQSAIRLAEDGADVVLAARRLERLEETAKICQEKGVRTLCVQADITKHEDRQKIVDQTIEKFGTIDVLVNNAHGGELPISKSVQEGYFTTFSFIDTPISFYEHFMKGNLYSTVEMMQLCIPYMKGKEDASIINFSSSASIGIKGIGAGRVAFGTAKGAVAVMSRIAAYELGELGIRVNCIYPTAVTDSMTEAIDNQYMSAVMQALAVNPLKRAGDSYRDIAPVVSFLASEDSRFITGSAFYCEGGGWMSM